MSGAHAKMAPPVPYERPVWPLRSTRGVLPSKDFSERLAPLLKAKGGARRLRLATQAWKSVAAAIGALRVNLSWGSPEHRWRLGLIQRFARKWLLGVLGRGEDWFATIKDYCTEVRLAVMNGDRLRGRMFGRLVQALGCGTPRRALQLTFLGRALPYGTESIKKQALKKHVETIRVEFETQPEILHRAKVFAHTWAVEHRLDMSSQVQCSIPVQESSCYERPLGRGGLVGAVRARLGPMCLLPNPDGFARMVVDERKRQDLGLGVWYSFSTCEEESIEEDFDIVCDDEGNLLPPQVSQDEKESSVRPPSSMTARECGPRARVVAIAERGMKARIVTCHAAHRVVILHEFRRRLMRALSRDPRISLVMDGDHSQAVRQIRAYGKDLQVLSADLSNASDRLPHDLVRAVIDGLCDGAEKVGGCRPMFRSLLRKWAVCEYELEYSKDGEPEVAHQGIQMGLPTTWALLSIIHLFWLDEASRKTGWMGSKQARVDLDDKAKETGLMRVFESESLSRQARICGDDLIVVAPRVVCDEYEKIGRACNAEFSAKKHFRSRRFGMFTEEPFEFRFSRAYAGGLGGRSFPPLGKSLRTSGGSRKVSTKRKYLERLWRGPIRLTRIKRVRAIPLRWATGSTRWQVELGEQKFATRKLPVWACLGPASESIIRSGSSTRMVADAVRAAWPSVARYVARLGIPPYLPRIFGGAGLPALSRSSRRVGRVAPRWLRRGLAGWLCRSAVGSPGPITAWLSAISPMWSCGIEQAAAVIEHSFVTARGLPVPWAMSLGSVEDAEGNLASWYVRLKALQQGGLLTSKELPVSVYRVVRALRKWAAAQPSGKPFHPTKYMSFLRLRYEAMMQTGEVYYVEKKGGELSKSWKEKHVRTQRPACQNMPPVAADRKSVV